MFTLFHVLVSLTGILTGLFVAGNLAGGKRLTNWAAYFMTATLLTSVTGFGFPADALLPSHIVGIVTLVVLAAVLVAHIKQLAGPWRRVYAWGVVAATYLNTFVLVVQLFRRVPDLNALAPTQSEPSFGLAQMFVLISFIWLGVAANAGLRSTVAR